MSTSENHLFFLKLCNKLAKSAVEKGNHPFGAILVHRGQIIASSENEVESQRDVTAHAEMLLIKKAQKILSQDELQEATLYSSTEPCAMCSGAIYWAGITEVIFGCSTSQLFQIVKQGLNLSSQIVFNAGTRSIKTLNLSTEAEFVEIHKSFWN